MFSALNRELRHALRAIARTPGLSFVAVLSLALGIAANTSIFSLAHSFLLRPLPYTDADRLAVVWESQLSRFEDRQGASPADYFDWREQASSFDALIASDFTTRTLTGSDRPEQLSVARVSPDFFTVLGSEPIHGRTFRSDEGRTGEAPTAVLSESLWRGRLGADDVVGTELTLDGEKHTVVGVMPEGFDFLLGTVDLWVASDFEAQRQERADRSLIVTGRLKPGISFDQAQAEMSAIASRLETLHPETHEGYGVRVQAVRDIFPGATDTRLIQILTTVVSLVLLIACVNVASLLLAKSDARQKEMAVRTALGAGRGRLLRQLLTESLVLALIAGALGTLLSVWGVRGIADSMPDLIPSFHIPRLDGPVIAFSLMMSVLAGLTFGISPALQAVRGNLNVPLMDSCRGATSTRQRKRLLSSFVVAEFALALTILIGAAILTDVFQSQLDIEPGFDPGGLLTLQLEMSEHRFADDEAVVGFVDRLDQGLRAAGGASALTFASELPRTRNLPFTEVAVDGRPAEPGEEPETGWLAVHPGYFAAMGITLEEGRGIAEADDAGAPPVVVVNRRLVELHFADLAAGAGSAGGSPVGRRLTVEGASREIIGVAADVVQERMSGIEPLEPAVYFPLAQHPVRRLYAVMRAPAGDPYLLAEPTRQAIWRVDSQQPISELRTMEEHMAIQIAGPTVIARVLFAVGLLALALAAMGTYGVMSFAVSQQTGEIGLRMALGARPGQILSRVTRQGAGLAAIGLLIGIPASAVVVRLINGLFEAAASDGLNPVGGIPIQPILEVGAVLALVGLIACYLPARRATRIDPVAALQNE